MARADAAAIAGGVPGTALMEAAGRAVADAVLGRHRPRPVVVLCGPGNNGGDGFVAARHLQDAGWPVRVGLLGARGALKGDAAWAAEAWQGPVEVLSTGLLDGRPLVVDALFGAGLTRPLDGVAGAAIDRINSEALTVVAVDVPSGLHGDSGEVMGCAPFAERTVTFFRAKPGHYSLEGLRRCGVLNVADIGIPRTVLDKIAPQTWLNGPALWRHQLRREDLADHKYARGHLTILGGATATGASRLAALAGRRAGAGLATIATPRSAMAIYQAGEAGQPRCRVRGRRRLRADVGGRAAQCDADRAGRGHQRADARRGAGGTRHAPGRRARRRRHHDVCPIAREPVRCHQGSGFAHAT